MKNKNKFKTLFKLMNKDKDTINLYEYKNKLNKYFVIEYNKVKSYPIYSYKDLTTILLFINSSITKK